MKNHIASLVFIIALAMISGTGAARAQQPASADTASRWTVQISPYAWATGLRGDISPFRRGPSIKVNKSFNDVMDDLKFGGFVNFWARYDRFVLSVDAMYVDTDDARSIGALPRIGPTPGLSAGVDSTMFSATLQAGYRVYDTPKASLDLMAGGRWWRLSNTATVKYDGFSISYGEDFGWVDPLIGARAFVHLTDKLSLLGQADIGGFDAGSQLTWQVLATVNYAFTDNISGSIGYKALSVDYNSSGHVFETTFSGPVVGMTYRF
ncbi:DUF481 domain-containing protein [Pseudochelatococcus contaminans]|uniref:Opacity protein-like surface antigen n=1 Tax=Pseudochelatococcus contaminans TaxID=1538103 RepID=A0A7W5Z1G8_9HYPH|nr:DUF481 domain-containing protein [Pseudochelatococcus contaminans]MBB3808345.1 opacity protein-like surface antigen [Pseudochelatococcus contaminans]